MVNVWVVNVLQSWEGIKIERTRARNILLCVCTEIGEKVNFLVKPSVLKNFQLESSHTQYLENIIGLGDRASILKL